MKTSVTLNGRTYNGIDRFILDGKIFKFTGEIPEGYTAIKGIKNPNSAYIDIGIPILSTDTVELSFNYDDVNNAVGIIFGWRVSGTGMDGNQCLVSKGEVREDSQSPTYIGHMAVIGKGIRGDYLDGKTNVFDDRDTTISINFATPSVYVNGAEIDVPLDISKAFNNGSSVFNPILFGLNNAGTPAGLNNFLETRLYGFSVIRNGEYVVEMLPVKKNDGTIGMYDIARGQFFGSSNANAFAE